MTTCIDLLRDRPLRRAIALACALLSVSTARATQQAVIVVEDEAAIAGPIIVVRNDQPGLDVRASLRDAVLSVTTQLREPQLCIRGVALVSEVGEPIAAADNPSALLKGLSIGAGLFGVRRSGSMPTQQITPPQVPPQVPQPPRGAPPPVPPAPPVSGTGPTAPQSGSHAIGVGVSIGGALFDFLRSRCESSLQTRFALPAGVAPETLTAQVVVGARGDPEQKLALQLRLQQVSGEWVGVAR